MTFARSIVRFSLVRESHRLEKLHWYIREPRKKRPSMPPVIRWLYLNFRYRLWPLPTDQGSLKKIAIDLKVPLDFTYRKHGLDVALAQQLSHESLKSFRWSAPLVLVLLSFGLVIGCIVSKNL
jgi:hypothetical protein